MNYWTLNKRMTMENQEEKEKKEELNSWRRSKNWNTLFIVGITLTVSYYWWIIVHYFVNQHPFIPTKVGFILLDEEFNFACLLTIGLFSGLVLRLRKHYPVSTLLLALSLFLAYVLQGSVRLNELFI